MGVLNPPPNYFCKYHFLELWHIRHPRELIDGPIQRQIQYEIDKGDDRYRKFLIDG